jgi:PhzF family phenazine biosynthesis protein
MQPQSIAIVDAFTSKPYAGNQAAVCLLDSPASEAWMQAVAREMNLAETAFLLPRGDGFELRWFTPTREVDLCGHATLASAHYLWESGALAPEKVARFHTLSGLLTATRLSSSTDNSPAPTGAWIELDFPAEPVRPCDAPANIERALGVSPLFVGRNRMDYLVELSSEREVRDLRPDLTEIARIEARGVIVTAQGTGEAEIVSRCFFPRYGIDEDPVTGSAHCALAPYWNKRLGKTELLAYQASARGGWLRIREEGDRVKLLGQAVITLRGELSRTETS